MISREDIQALIDRSANGNPVLSVFLDMSVNSDNKRTHTVFLNKEKSSFQELDSDRQNHHREALGAAFERLETWLANEYEEVNRGVAFYTEIGGDWTAAHQVPLPLRNRLKLDDRPIVTPLVEIVERYHHHGVVVVDREHLRLLSLYLDQTLYERTVETEPYPAPHDVKRGGFSAKDFQQRKAEETKHFFKEFADEVATFDRTYHPDDLILMGTHENVTKFTEFLPEALRKKIIHEDRIEVDATAAEIREKLAPVFEQRVIEEEARAIETLRGRLKEDHKAVSGFERTLEQLQEGKVDTLVISREIERGGGRCEKCNFILARDGGECPYCGGAVRNGVDLVEEMVRLAEDQSIVVDIVAGDDLSDMDGVGGLLRF